MLKKRRKLRERMPEDKQTAVVKTHESLEREIKEEQARLRERDPSSPLLKMVTVDTGIHWTADFGGRYEGMTTLDGLNQYVADLRSAVETAAQTQPLCTNERTSPFPKPGKKGGPFDPDCNKKY